VKDGWLDSWNCNSPLRFPEQFNREINPSRRVGFAHWNRYVREGPEEKLIDLTIPFKVLFSSTPGVTDGRQRRYHSPIHRTRSEQG
jgi:hypothetical protein